MRDKISDTSINRAVDLWCKKLKIPAFDNGDDSDSGGMAFALATLSIQKDKNSIHNMDERIEVFRKVLTDSLIKIRDSDEYFPSSAG